MKKIREKKKIFLSVLLTVSVVFSLSVPAFALSGEKYGNEKIYDETGLLEKDLLFSSLDENALDAFSEHFGIDLRVDVITTLGRYDSLNETAAGIYDTLEYGAGEGKNGVSLTVLVQPDEDAEMGVVLDDWVLYAGGDSFELQNAPMNLYPQLERFMEKNSWDGDDTVDSMMLSSAMKAMLDGMREFVYAGGVAGTIYDPKQLNTTLVSAKESGSTVFDLAGLLSEEEEAELDAMAKQATEQYDCGVYLMTVEDFGEFTDAPDIISAAEEIYDRYGFGTGEDNSGIFLLLSLADRDYDLMAHGFGNTAFTDYGKEYLSEHFLDELGEDDWFQAFFNYLETSGEMLEKARDGKPVDIGSNPLAKGLSVLILIGVSFLAAAAVKSHFAGQLDSVGENMDASDYETNGGLNLTGKSDLLTRTTRTQRKIEKSSGSSGGTTVNSSGSSHQSGKF